MHSYLVYAIFASDIVRSKMATANCNKRKRSSYDAGFKLRVVDYAEQSTNSAAGREFGVSEKLVRDWRKQAEVLRALPKTKKARRGDHSHFPELEDSLHEWVLECRQNGFIVTRQAIRFRALMLVKEEPHKSSPSAGQFVASAGWCTRFMDRHGLALRQRTKIAQKLPQDLAEKVTSFQKFVIGLRQKFDYDLSQIGNMDETPMTFDLPGNRTVNPIGEKTVMVKTTGHEKTHFTVVLSCMADGTRLKPLVIFKRKTLPKAAKFPRGVVVKAHPKGWMDEAGTKDWLRDVWNKRPGALLNQRSMLVWDMFRAHITDDVKAAVKSRNTDLCVIPGGLTSMLQPLDVCLNKPFKDRLRQTWTAWMTSGSAKTTKGGNLQKPDITVVCQWVVDAWESIPSEMIAKSFLKCGISNALDGSEDDAVYEDEGEEEADEDAGAEDDDNDVYNDDGRDYTNLLEQFNSDNDDSDFEGFAC